jgi:hypothetical protein
LILILGNSGCKSTNSTDKKVLLLGKVDYKGSSEELNIQKFDAALNIASKTSGKYISLPFTIWDTLAKQHPDIKSPVELAEEADADYIVFAKINVLKNIMRTQIVLTDVNDESKKMSGVGYSSIKYIESGSGKPVYDPSLLESLQRAMAIASGDSNMFVKSEIGINIKPLPTLVIGPINFSRSEYSENWEIFQNKEVNSYAGIETIFDVYKTAQKYIVYDSETRDSVYRLFGFNIVENYSPPSNSEVKALYNLEVDYFIAGNIEFFEDTADIDLFLYLVENGSLKLVKSAKEHFVDDSRMVLLEHISRASKKLLE